MTDRREIEQLIGELYDARVTGRLNALCALFADDAGFRIVGASDGKPIAITAAGMDQIRPWLAVLVKSFDIEGHEILSVIVEGESAAVHWRGRIHSKITGSTVSAELVDLFEVRANRISSYREFCVPC